MKTIYTTIPVQLCQYALLNGMTNHLKLYVYFKHIASGHLERKSSLYERWGVDVELSEKTVRKIINELIQKKWITVNSKRNSLRIISYAQLCRKLDIKSKMCVIYEPEEFSGFREFCCAAVYTYQANVKSWRGKNRLSVSKMVGTSKNSNLHLKGYKTLPIRYFAKSVGVSISTANSFKQAAVKAGYIEVKRRVVNITDSNGKKIDRDMLSVIAIANEDLAPRLRIGKKYLKNVEADLIKSLLIIKKKRFKYREKR